MVLMGLDLYKSALQDAMTVCLPAHEHHLSSQTSLYQLHHDSSSAVQEGVGILNSASMTILSQYTLAFERLRNANEMNTCSGRLICI